MLRKTFFAACLVSLVFGSQVGWAGQLVNIDFNGADAGNTPPGPGPTATGAAVVGSAGDAWNGLNFNSGTVNGLLNSTGSSTSVDVSWNSTGSWNAGGSPAPNTALMQDYLYQLGGTASVNMSGLIPNAVYNLYLYTQNNDNNDRQADFTINGTLTGQSGAGSQGATSWINGTNYTEFVGVHPDATGHISISFTPDGNHAGEADLNGLQLSTNAPEPGTLLLAGLGAAGLLVVARRRRKA